MQNTMFYFSEVLLLLLCATWGHAICSVYVTGDVIQRLSDLPANCSSVHNYLTSGNHSLVENLIFSDSVEDAVINSTSPSQPAIIECRNGTGISFGRVTKVTISNIVFSHCHTRVTNTTSWYSLTKQYSSSPVALYFRNAQYTLSNVTVINTVGYGLYAEQCKEQVIFNCTFNNNSIGHVGLALAANATVTINNTIFNNSGRAGVSIIFESDMQVEVSNSTFINTSLVLQLELESGNYVGSSTIRDCNFTQNKVQERTGVFTMKGNQNVTLERISMEKNYGLGDCSVLHAQNRVKLTLNNVNIADNNCTGVKLLGSTMKLENSVNITGNRGVKGGALLVNHYEEIFYLDIFTRTPPLTFTKSSMLNIINNSADIHGGGIYLHERCDYRSTKKCFFTLMNYSAATKVFLFSGNVATKGGDSIFGGCLSDCVIGDISINKSDPNNTFWKLANSTKSTLSSFLEDPSKVTFCQNTSTLGVTCNDSHTVSVYRGQTFTVPLMVIDEFCTPSVGKIEAKVCGGGTIKDNIIQKGKKHCQNFSYTLLEGTDENSTTIAFSKRNQIHSPVILTVQLKECPTGYKYSGTRCNCMDMLSNYAIKCNLTSFSLSIPAQTWLGELKEESGLVGVRKDCRYCHKEETREITNITEESYKLCIANRTGILCGACAEGYSLQLGGYKCADCTNSINKIFGVLLLISFAIIGIALVLLLLCLNLTVSTGMINGLIFYSNIVYLNSEALLPISREGSSTHLENTVEILYIFQAWMNLDFGVTMCFFNGYTTYISTWMQFAFPLYIWLLILVIVLSSRYSSKISKLAISNTVSVLATLLLLAYAKLLKALVEACFYIHLDLLDNNRSHTYWYSDANVPYLGSTHLPLFLTSLVMVLVYILPFTLLILLGPLLQAKSHYRLLKWINKLKPFLDAFYGPYTRRYRYWPGILLLARVAIIYNFAFSPLNIANSVGISLMVIFLLVIWLAIGKTSTLSLHQRTHLNYIELFFLLNLGLFTAISVYLTQFPQNKMRNQQGLAVAMVGSVLALACGILVYHIYNTVSKFRAVRKIAKELIKKGKCIPKKNSGGDNKKTSESCKKNPGTVTHSLVKMAECADAGEQLREPLLISDIH